MDLIINRKDVFWGFFGQFFSIASGIITLPIILRLLSPSEVGFNYLMLTIGSLVTLFDFGFAPQIGINITYIFSGAQELRKEGYKHNDSGNKQVNYHLLLLMITAARFLYKRLSIVILGILLTIGSCYIYRITHGFSSVSNAFPIWIIFCVSIYFDIYFAYYSSLLNGRGLITEYRKAVVYSKLVYTVLCIVLLLLGFGLISVVISNFIAAFVSRYFCHKYFFSNELKGRLYNVKIETKEVKRLLPVIWFNAKKIGLVYIGSFAVSKMGLFIAGLYLSLHEIGSYGLMVQLVGLIAVVSSTISTIYQPRLTSLKIKNEKILLLKEFAYTVIVFLVLYLLGAVVFIFFGNSLLSLIKSTTALPSLYVLLIYCIVTLLETNFSIFSSYIVTGNQIPFVKSTLFAGFLITILTFLVLRFTNLRILGVVLVPGLIQALYNYWKWPLLVCKGFETSFFKMLLIGQNELLSRTKVLFGLRR